MPAALCDPVDAARGSSGGVRRHAGLMLNMPLKFRIPPPGDFTVAPDSPVSDAFSLGCQLWISLKHVPVTAEAVGWLSLLSKSLDIGRQLRLDHDALSHVGMAAVERLFLETHTHVHAVCRPLVKAGAGNLPAGRPTTETRKALRLYAAWCINSELELLADLSDKRTLDDIWEPHTARRLIRDLGAARPEYERLLGPIPEDSDQELALDRKKSEEALQATKTELLGLVATISLEPMLKRLKQKLEKAREQKKLRGVPSFPAVYAIMSGDAVPTVREQPKNAAVGFTYSWYSVDSLQLHGSSLALEFDRAEIGPRLLAPSSASPDDLAQLLRDLLFRLAFLRSYLPHDA